MSEKNSSAILGNIFGSKSTFIYEDNHCMVFEEEFNPQAAIHFLVVPKKILSHISTASNDDARLLGHLLRVAGKIAEEKGLEKNGFHVMVDEDFKTLRLKCLHVFGRALQHMLWPTGPVSRL